MVKGGKRGGRVRDKWRDKQWVVVNTPSAFGGGPLNYIPVTNIEQARGRVIENTMFDILKQDPTQHQTKVFIQIEKINDGIATTVFKGHEYAKEFLRSLVKKRKLYDHFCKQLHYARRLHLSSCSNRV